MIKFLVKGQDIETLEHEVIAADQVSFVNVKFAFDNNWKPLHKVVKFVQECEEYFRVLGVDGTSCYLPAELHPGAVKMSLFGYDPNATETVRATTVIHTLHVRPSGFEGEGSTPVPPTPDLYQQLLKEIERGGDGKSAFEIAVEHGYVGTVEQWLESLKGADGTPGADGRDGTDGMPGADGHDGADGKSAYEIAVEHGYSGTEEEWISEMKPDLSAYPRREELLLIIERKLEPTQEKAHVHENKAVLDSISAEDYALLDGLQQFEDSTQHDIQSLNEAVSSLNSRTHTHSNKSVLDSITQADKAAIDSLPQFKDGVEADLSELRESVSTVVEQAHWHHNLTVLNGITAAKVAKWDSNGEWQLPFQTLQGNVMDYQMQMNHRMDESDQTVSDLDTQVQQLRDSNQYDHQNMNDSINLLENRIGNLETELEGIETILRRVVG